MFTIDAIDQGEVLNKNSKSLQDTDETGVQLKTTTKISKFEQLFGECFAKRKKAAEDASEIEFVVSSYLAPGVHCDLGTENINPMKWWDDHKSAFPKLAKITLKLFTIVTKSVPPERVFSVTGNKITEKGATLVLNWLIL